MAHAQLKERLKFKQMYQRVQITSVRSHAAQTFSTMLCISSLRARARVSMCLCVIVHCAACDDVTRSEIVVPVFSPEAADGCTATSKDSTPAARLLAVLDIDSEVLAAFDDVDRVHLEALVAKYF